jgi:hypothetical protein
VYLSTAPGTVQAQPRLATAGKVKTEAAAARGGAAGDVEAVCLPVYLSDLAQHTHTHTHTHTQRGRPWQRGRVSRGQWVVRVGRMWACTVAGGRNGGRGADNVREAAWIRLSLGVERCDLRGGQRRVCVLERYRGREARWQLLFT